MVRDKQHHHEQIISAAAAEFLEYGFNDASMRRIAAAAGMSVSGLYKHFAGKEEMFAALVEPAFQGLMDLYHREETAQKKKIELGDTSDWDNGKDAELLITYIYDHLDAFKLIVCKSKGTAYEHFLHDLAVLEEKTTLQFMDLLRRQGVKIRDYDRNEFHLLVTVNISAVFQTVEHSFTREQALHYAETLDRFFSKAWAEFFGF